MQRTGGTAALVGLAAVLNDIGLQFRGCGLALCGTLKKQAAQFTRRRVLGAGVEAEFAILAGLDQVVQGVDDVVIGHGEVPFIRGERRPAPRISECGQLACPGVGASVSAGTSIAEARAWESPT